jgi:hypothetical protein
MLLVLTLFCIGQARGHKTQAQQPVQAIYILQTTLVGQVMRLGGLALTDQAALGD